MKTASQNSWHSSLPTRRKRNSLSPLLPEQKRSCWTPIKHCCDAEEFEKAWSSADHCPAGSLRSILRTQASTKRLLPCSTTHPTWRRAIPNGAHAECVGLKMKQVRM